MSHGYTERMLQKIFFITVERTIDLLFPKKENRIEPALFFA
jgi:hypothetical protein